MANSTRYDDLGVLSVNPVAITGRFFPNSTTDPTQIGVGFDVTHQGTGLFRIQLRNSADSANATYPLLIAALATASENTPTETIVTFDAYDETNGTIDVNVFQAGTATDLTANADTYISFMLLFRNSSVNFPPSTAA